MPQSDDPPSAPPGGENNPRFDELVDHTLGPVAPDASPSQPRGPDAAAEERALLARVVDTLRAVIVAEDADEPSVGAMRATLARFREARPTRAGWLEGVRSVVAQLIHDSRGASLMGLRSADVHAVVHCAFECGLGRLDLQAIAIDEGTRWRLRGQILTLEAEPTEVRARSTSTEGGTESIATIDQGSFALILAPDTYELTIELDGGAAAFTAGVDLRSP